MALLLFAFIAYGATAEVVHKHGNFAGSNDDAASSVRSANDESGASQNSRQGDACLICQLHQNLFVTLFNAQPKLSVPPAVNVRTATQPTSYLSQIDAPRRGRAPPLASLL